MHNPIEEAAAAWAMRHPLNPNEQAQLERWLAADRRHAGALLRAQAGLSVADKVIAPDRHAPARVDGGADRDRRSRRWFLGATAGIAATIAAIVASPVLLGERIATTRGEIRRLPLADGSVATIDADSALRVVLDQDSRRIALLHGQAWFQVAKDRDRPFIVDAGLAQARAVGTAFAVHRTDAGVRISVTEGRVAVWPSEADGAMTILEAGQFAVFRTSEAPPVTSTAPAVIERSLAWRSGEISLENETLSEAVAQFNRYNSQQLVIADPTLGRERLVGLFRIDSPDVFAETLAASLDVSVEITPSQIRLSRKKSERP